MSTRSRTLPHDLEAERAVLGALLIDNLLAVSVADLAPALFFRKAHGAIYGSVVSVIDSGRVADLVTLKDELEKTGALEECGGAAYLASLLDGVPRSANVPHYAGIVRDKAKLRATIKAATMALNDAYAGERPVDDILRDAEQGMVDLRRGHFTDHLQSLSGSIARMMDDLTWRTTHRGALRGWPTGFASIDALTMGWQAGDVVIVAARPSIGKTSWVLNTATAVAAAQGRVVFFSLEMRREQLESRLLSSLSGVALSRLLAGALASSDWPAISAALETINVLPIEIDDSTGRTVRDIRTTCRHVKSDRGLGLVVVDYVQLMASSLDRRGTTRNEEMTDISRRLKELAGELEVPIIVLSQLRRISDQRAGQRPRLDDLRESGSLEQDADMVCFLHRKHHLEGGLTKFIIEKQRNGPGGVLNLTLERDLVRFVDGGEDEPEPAKEAKPKRVRSPGRW